MTDGVQLVVAGNQSSGKSSLLENLLGIPFPTDVKGELCVFKSEPTTFAYVRSQSALDMLQDLLLSVDPRPSGKPSWNHMGEYHLNDMRVSKTFSTKVWGT